MNIVNFSEMNSNAPSIRHEDVSQVVIRELCSHIDLAADLPCRSVLQRDPVKPVYGDIEYGDCHVGLLFDGLHLWGAYRCSAECEFTGAWCWIMCMPYTFGVYSADARAVYYREGDDEGWRACAHHSLAMDVAIYTFWEACR